MIVDGLELNLYCPDESYCKRKSKHECIQCYFKAVEEEEEEEGIRYHYEADDEEEKCWIDDDV